MTKNCRNWPEIAGDGQGWLEMTLDGHKWPEIVRIGWTCSEMAGNDRRLPEIDREFQEMAGNDQKLPELARNDLEWPGMASDGRGWSREARPITRTPPTFSGVRDYKRKARKRFAIFTHIFP